MTDAGSVEGRRRDWLIACALAALALAVRSPLIRWDLNLSDEGLLVQTVERLLHGEVLYSEVYNNYAPAILYVFVPLFDLFGPSVVVTRAVWLLFLAATSALVYLVGRSLAPRWAAAWAAVLPIFVVPPAHKMFVPLTIAAGLALCRQLATAQGDRRRRILIGAAIGLVALVRQEIGGYTFVIAVATLLAVSTAGNASRIKSVRDLALGTAVVCLPVVVVFAALGALPDAVHQLLTGGLEENTWMALPFPPLAGVVVGPERLKTSLFYAPAVAALLGLALLYFQREHFSGSDRTVLAQWTLMALLTHSQFLQRSDLPHVSQALVAPSLILAAVAGRAFSLSREPRQPATTRRLAAAASAAAILWGSGVLWFGTVSELLIGYAGRSRGVLLEEPRASVFLRPNQHRLFSEVLARIRAMSAPGEPVLVAPYIPMFGFIAGRPNPTRYAELYSVLLDLDRQREVIAALDEGPVRLILVHDTALDGKEERRFPRYAPEVANYLESQFQIAERLGPFVFFVRKGSSHRGGT